MRIGIKILLGYLLISGAAVYFLTFDFLSNVRTRYLEGVEDVLVDQARLLAGFVAADMADGRGVPQRLQTVFDAVYGCNFSARIYALEKTATDIRVYVTDDRGIVVFDSRDPGLVGADYGNWRDVFLTLRGQYGARTSHEDAANRQLSTLYVAAPIVHQGRIAGVLTVGKPTVNINRFLEMARRQITRKSVAAAICLVALSTLFMLVVFRPIKRLTDYADAVRRGEKASLPRLGRGEIGDMGRAFEKMRQALEDKAYVERYVQTLTHEIKSPVSAIAGAAELLEEEMPPSQRARFLDNIRREAERIRRLVERLLALAAIEGQQSLKQRTRVDLDEVVARVIVEMMPQLGPLGIRIRSGLDRPAPAVSGDPFLLRQAVFNLIQNAVDFSPPDGEIRVTLAPHDSGVALTVADNGPGIPDFARERVFEKFYSLSRPRSGQKSTGLGLNFVREIAVLHGGRIDLQNRPSGGLNAVLTLPAAGPRRRP